jgi:hypothetical protein
MPLPTFLVIGAQKCGTSSLHSYLAAHPDIEMPAERKELDFFLEGEHGTAALGEDWYASRWRGDTEIRGEASPNYTAHPFHHGVAARAAALVPDARLVFLARDPIERAVSHYVHRRAHDLERRPLDAVLADLDDPGNGLVQRSLYMAQLDQWLEHYPADRLLVVASERLRRQREETLDGIFAFLGAAPGFRDHALATERNTADERRELTAGALALERAPAARLARRLVPAAVKRRLRAGMSRQVDVPEVTPGLRARLEDKLRPDLARLRAFTGDDFAEWSL